MASGAVSLDQARVIVRYVGELAKDVPAPLVAGGEADMIGFCAQLDPVLLGVLGGGWPNWSTPTEPGTATKLTPSTARRGPPPHARRR